MPETPLQKMIDATQRARTAQEVAREIGRQLAEASPATPATPATEQPS